MAFRARNVVTFWIASVAPLVLVHDRAWNEAVGVAGGVGRDFNVEIPIQAAIDRMPLELRVPVGRFIPRLVHAAGL